MKPEQQRIAIAKACGWKNCGWDTPHGFSFSCPCGAHPDNAGYITLSVLPDYLNDLNVMREAEGKLTLPQFRTYCDCLFAVAVEFYGPTGTHYAMQSTAAQRAEAFLRTLTLWTD